MDLLKELNDLLQSKIEVTEAKHVTPLRSVADAMDAYLDVEKMYHFEGSRGLSNLDKVLNIIGYRNLDEFLSDNPGCIENMLEWIKDQDNEEWLDNLNNKIDDSMIEEKD